MNPIGPRPAPRTRGTCGKAPAHQHAIAMFTSTDITAMFVIDGNSNSSRASPLSQPELSGQSLLTLPVCGNFPRCLRQFSRDSQGPDHTT